MKIGPAAYSCRSEPQIPHQSTFSFTVPSRTCGSGMSSTRRSPRPWKRSAFIGFAPLLRRKVRSPVPATRPAQPAPGGIAGGLSGYRRGRRPSRGGAMADRLTGMPVAFLIANEGAERIELSEPWQAVDQEGALPSLVSLEPGHATLFDHLDRADAWPVDEVRATDFGGLVLPGGVANPDRLRMDRRAVALVRSFVDSGRPVAVICHGAWTLVEADVLRGRTITSYPSLRTDIINAGGIWE